MEFIGSTLCSLVGEQVNHLRSLNDKMDKLKRKYEELNSRKEDVVTSSGAEVQRGKRLKKEVEVWLKNVKWINDQKQSIENKVREGSFFARARLGKLVSETIEEVEELYQKGNFLGSLLVDAPPRIGHILPTTTLAGETSKRKVGEIWASLMKDDVRKIGVYGMVGVVKTTLMKYINNHLLEETDLFDDVIWATVTEALDIFELQTSISCALNQDLSKYKDSTIRAAKIFAVLRNKTRYVLILDDLWEAFHLEDVGIPEPSPENGCKLVLTTQSLDVCRSMRCNDIKVELLTEEESWNLFLDKVGRDVLVAPNLAPTVKLVSQQCGRLPLAIIRMADRLKCVTDICEWRYALEELRYSTQRCDDNGCCVLKQMKLSYSRVTKKLQDCLLCSALYPEDFQIERKELIEYLIAEGIVEGTKSRQAEFDEGHALLNNLENACLLESVTDDNANKCVKMHNLIRTMVLQIASLSLNFMVEVGVRLTDLPDKERWGQDLEKVSLMNNCISEIPSTALPRCDKLATLLLQRNSFLENIPSSFFVQMCGLNVLDLSYTGIVNLPDSISNLENLTSLSLRRCKQLGDLPSLTKLTAIRKLDLAYTGIKEVPQGMDYLVNLSYLNLYAPLLRTFPAGVLSKLSRPQYFLVKWSSETLKILGEEVAGLKKLETFAGKFYDLHNLNVYVRSLQEPGPSKYLFRVGPVDAFLDFDNHGEDKYFTKDVRLRACSICGVGENSLELPKDVQFLQIDECHDLKSLCSIPSLSKAADLNSCEVINCSGLECLLSPPAKSYHVLLQSLRTLHIEGCNNIKRLFELCILLHLQNLEEIRVHDCKRIEEVVAEGTGEGIALLTMMIIPLLFQG